MAAAKRELAALEIRGNDVAARQGNLLAAQKNDDAALGIDALREKLADRRAALERAQQTNEQLRVFVSEVDRQILGASNRLAKALSLRGQSWLRTEAPGAGKRPVVILVGASGAEFKPLDAGETPQIWPASAANRKFSAFCRELDSDRRYVVFLIRPSGIALFEELVSTARATGVGVGYDAITERQVIHVGPPPLDEPTAESAPPRPGTPLPPPRPRHPLASRGPGPGPLPRFRTQRSGRPWPQHPRTRRRRLRQPRRRHHPSA